MKIDPYDLILCLTYRLDSALCIKLANLLEYDEKALGFTLSYYTPKIPLDAQIKDILVLIDREDVNKLLSSSYQKEIII